MSIVEWPNLDDVSLRLDGLHYDMLSAEQAGVFVRLVWCLATMSVNTHYSDAEADPGLPLDEALLRRITRCGAGEWRRSKAAVLQFFEIRDGKWRLKDPSIIRISRTGRSPIPLAVKAAVLGRDGRRCSYCGSTDGPFHFDHIFPLSRGGSDDSHNITVACAPCNMSKGDKTLHEWMESGK